MENPDSNVVDKFVRVKFLDHDDEVTTLLVHDVLEFKAHDITKPLSFDKGKAYNAKWYDEKQKEFLQLRVKIAKVGNDAKSTHSQDGEENEDEIDEPASDAEEQSKPKRKKQAASVPSSTITKEKHAQKKILLEYKKNLCEKNTLNVEFLETQEDPLLEPVLTINNNVMAHNTNALEIKNRDLSLGNERLKKELGNAKCTIQDLRHEIDVYAAINKDLQLQLHKMKNKEPMDRENPPSPIYDPENDSQRNSDQSRKKENSVTNTANAYDKTYEEKLKDFRNASTYKGNSNEKSAVERKKNEWKDNREDDFLDELERKNASSEPEYHLGHGRKVKRRYLKWLLQLNSPMKFAKNFMYVLYYDDKQISLRSKDGKNSRKDKKKDTEEARIIIEDEEMEIMSSEYTVPRDFVVRGFIILTYSDLVLSFYASDDTL
ncbi:hypothetical protein QAD02_002053 [Eretmocerus hayati]|uniref:Uncharacterized protein n=1 Tax=Eretmocerus hayati TaxID=131215 RepID=A0ACC2NHS9_9HYME|nr:hypothetical protein QAD02_002053 [Eretmocerus hayati]